eukprot:scaffold354778_cov26-Prasinocladus_malaysianus.AAC.1
MSNEPFSLRNRCMGPYLGCRGVGDSSGNEVRLGAPGSGGVAHRALAGCPRVLQRAHVAHPGLQPGRADAKETA